MLEKNDLFSLVLASQRTGSTLLCRDLESLGVGAPREYAVSFLKKRRRLGLKDLEELFLKCQTKTELGEIHSLKLMLNYAPKIVEAVHPDLKGLKPTRSREEHIAVVQLFIEVLEKRFEKVPIFILTRDDILEVSSSRALAQLTRIHHTLIDVEETNQYEHLAEDVILDKILETLPRAVRENRMLHMLKSELGSRALHVEYEQLVNDPKNVESRCKDYLAGFGLSFEEGSFDRSYNKKVVPQHFKDQYIQKFREKVLSTL